MNTTQSGNVQRASLITVGKVIETGFDKGFVKVQSLSDNPKRFRKGNTVLIDFYRNIKQFTIQRSEKAENQNFLLTFKGFEDDEKSFVFAGKELFIEEAQLEQLPETKWYLHELLHCDVYQNGECIGKVTEVYSGDTHDILAIETKERGEILIPTVTEFIKKLDREQKQLILNPEIQLYDDEN